MFYTYIKIFCLYRFTYMIYGNVINSFNKPYLDISKASPVPQCSIINIINRYY